MYFNTQAAQDSELIPISTGGAGDAERDNVNVDDASPSSNPQSGVPPISIAETASASASLRMVIYQSWFLHFSVFLLVDNECNC